MAATTYEPTTSADVNKIWRKIQTKVYEAFKFTSEEWDLVDELQEFEVNWSTREIIVPLDLNEGAGIASIPEGGYEAVPSSPNVEEIFLAWALFNGRFTVTKTTRWIEQKSPGALIEKQTKFQAGKKIQDLGRHYSDYHYGFSTGYLAQVASSAGTTPNLVLTINNGYGKSTITDAAFIANKFKKGDRIALIRAGALVANGIGTITAAPAFTLPTTVTLTVTFQGAGPTPSAADYIVKANSQENTTLAGTDYNKGITGVFDALESTSVHQLSSSTAPNWSPVTPDATGGRFDGIRLIKASQEIANKGGGKMDFVYISQGVVRDITDDARTILRYNEPFDMEVTGSVKAKGMKSHSTKRVPPGYAICGVKSSHRKMTLLPKPEGGPVWEDAEKIADRSAYVFSIDWPCALVWLNRGNWKLHSGLTEQ